MLALGGAACSAAFKVVFAHALQPTQSGAQQHGRRERGFASSSRSGPSGAHSPPRHAGEQMPRAVRPPRGLPVRPRPACDAGHAALHSTAYTAACRECLARSSLSHGGAGASRLPCARCACWASSAARTCARPPPAHLVLDLAQAQAQAQACCTRPGAGVSTPPSLSSRGRWGAQAPPLLRASSDPSQLRTRRRRHKLEYVSCQNSHLCSHPLRLLLRLRLVSRSCCSSGRRSCCCMPRASSGWRRPVRKS